jgi:hypothetical protein
MATFSDVFDAVQALSPSEQLRLIDALWDNLSPSEWPSPSDEMDRGSTATVG